MSFNKTRWLPLESNPEVLNMYLRKLGVKDDVKFVDVFAFEKEMLNFIPRPVFAVLLLFPISVQLHTAKIGEEIEMPVLYYIKQTIGNACGTIGLIHALLNNIDNICLDENKHLGKFLNKTLNMTPLERGISLETDGMFEEVHGEVAVEGQTKAPAQDEKVDLHFVTFIHHEGILYELDGRRNGPVKHGATTEDSLLEDSVDVVKKFMERDPSNLNFTVVALVQE